MILRPRQEKLVNLALGALSSKNNTLAIAPTGAGKTIMLSAMIGEFIKLNPLSKVLVLQHRSEIFNQNIEKFKLVNPDVSYSIFNADKKNFSGQVVFSMVQTLSRKSYFKSLPVFDLVVVDEAHHMASDSYIHLLQEIKQTNEAVKVAGFTATPMRGDKKNLGQFFDNVCDQIEIQELIHLGHLVRPKTFAVDLGINNDLLKIQRSSSLTNMQKEALADDLYKFDVDFNIVVEKWKELAFGKKTVAFTPTIELSQKLQESFILAGVNAVHIDHSLSSRERDERLNFFQNDQNVQVVSNAMILTEGWDCPAVECVLLLRYCSFKSLFIQMVGRGLRPHQEKEECIILDFGISSITHGTLEQQIDDIFVEKKRKDGLGPVTKICPISEGGCNSEVPASSQSCPLCGFKFECQPEDVPILTEVKMKEIDLLNSKSNFDWVEVVPHFYIIPGFHSYIIIREEDSLYDAIAFLDTDVSFVVARNKNLSVCFSLCQQFIKEHSIYFPNKANKKMKNSPVTEKQNSILTKHDWTGKYFCGNLPKNSYEASASMKYIFFLRDQKNKKTKSEVFAPSSDSFSRIIPFPKFEFPKFEFPKFKKDDFLKLE